LVVSFLLAWKLDNGCQWLGYHTGGMESRGTGKPLIRKVILGHAPSWCIEDRSTDLPILSIYWSTNLRIS